MIRAVAFERHTLEPRVAFSAYPLFVVTAQKVFPNSPFFPNRSRMATKTSRPGGSRESAMGSWNKSAHEKADQVLGWKGRPEARNATVKTSLLLFYFLFL